MFLLNSNHSITEINIFIARRKIHIRVQMDREKPVEQRIQQQLEHKSEQNLEQGVNASFETSSNSCLPENISKSAILSEIFSKNYDNEACK